MWGLAGETSYFGIDDWSFDPRTNTVYVAEGAKWRNSDTGEFSKIPPGAELFAQHADTSGCVLSDDQPGNTYLPADKRTGKRQVAICGTFLKYWKANGGLAVFGMPIRQYNAHWDGPDGTLNGGHQWFERNRLELNNVDPGKATIRNVELGLLGAELCNGGVRDPEVAPKEGFSFFSKTGHNVCGDAQKYFSRNGAVAKLGLPLAEETQQTIRVGDSDQTITVQWFERARIELHPYDSQQPVKLGLLGNERVAQLDI